MYQESIKSPSVKVSVCVVCYNQQNYILECLKSILEQETNFEFEVIVSDDGSSDSTRSILRELSQKYSKIQLVFREKNIGPTQNSVQTHNMAIGEYICHVDGDDRWLPGKLQKQADFLDQNPEFAVVWTKSNYFNDRGGFLSGSDYKYPNLKNGEVSLQESLRLGTVAVTSSIMYRASAKKTKVANAEMLDLYFTWEYLTVGKGKILQDILTEYRMFSSGALTNSSNFNVRRLSSEHALYYLYKLPHERSNIFVFAFTNFIFDFIRKNKTSKEFFYLAVKSFSIYGLLKIPKAIFILKDRAINLS